MYSSKENINILTALLSAHGVGRAVVCPGSRNAPIVHNMHEAGIECHAVTDERSAGFYAIGMALRTCSPVAVCVTSGSALLNLAPAAAEAHYRHLPIIFISADRPPQWIGQLDGQTMPQNGALKPFVRRSVCINEPVDDETRWYCRRLVSEALLAMQGVAQAPVHINVPISEPLFEFDAVSLPEIKPVKLLRATSVSPSVMELLSARMLSARRPMIVAGQYGYNKTLAKALTAISKRVVVLQEPLSPGLGSVHFDEVLSAMGDTGDYLPDFILYVGDTLVSKRLKTFLRRAVDAETWAVSEDGEVHDAFCNQTMVIEGCAADVLTCISDDLEHLPAGSFRILWQSALDKFAPLSAGFVPRYSQMMAVKMFETMLEESDYDYDVHYANSSAVRLGCMFANHYIYVNRGVNGIEGSLSTAAGFSLAGESMTFCVTGDLSFFYDSNALWHGNIGGNLRVLLLNNAGGGIFRTLPGLERSGVRDKYVAGEHRSSAHGVCDAHDIGYISARNADELAGKMNVFLYSGTHRPLVFEVFTDAEDDAAALKEYLDYCKKESGTK